MSFSFAKVESQFSASSRLRSFFVITLFGPFSSKSSAARRASTLASCYGQGGRGGGRGGGGAGQGLFIGRRRRSAREKERVLLEKELARIGSVLTRQGIFLPIVGRDGVGVFWHEPSPLV